jgi:hypothetical protein
MRGVFSAIGLVGCLGTGLRPLNLDTGATDTDSSDPGGGGGGGGGGNGGGGGGDADTDVDSDSDADADTEPCIWPDASISATAPTAGTMTPNWVSLDLYGIIDGGDDFRDFHIDGVGDVPAAAFFTFYAPDVTPLCSVSWEITLRSVAPWSTASGPIGEAFEITLVGQGDASPNCHDVSGGVFPTSDIRDWIAAETWGIGIGEVNDLLSPVQTLASQLGYSFGADWQPHIYGVYLWRGGADALEVGYGFRYAHDCGLLLDDGAGGLVLEATPSPGDVDGYQQTFPLVVVNVGS